MAKITPDYDSIDWSVVEQRFREGALRRKLMRLAFTLTAIALVLLAVNLVALLWLRTNVDDLVHTRAPLVDATRKAQLGMQRALASLRGWVALRDQRFKEGRLAAWDDEIVPAIDRITLLAGGSDDAPMQAEVKEIRSRMDDLFESQWWIADVAHTPGHKPANLEYDRHVLPISNAAWPAHVRASTSGRPATSRA